MNEDSPEGHSSQPRKENGAEQKESLGFFKMLAVWLGRAKCEGTLKQSIEEIIDEHKEDGDFLSPEEDSILRNVLKFGDIRVTDVMTPRTDIVSVPIDITLSELTKIFSEKELTRMPVYRGNLDEVTGFIHIKDVFPYVAGKEGFDITRIIRDVLFVPPSMKVLNLLLKMRLARVHMALVVDEYGGTDGLVTIEDLVEEIVGEIEDEHDESQEPEFIKIDNSTYEANSRLLVKKLEELFGVKVFQDEDEEDFDTVGGLIFTSLGRVPKSGESIEHASGLRFEVLEADQRHIKRVRIIKTAPAAETAEQ